MSSIATSLNSGLPIIWIQTQEQFKTADLVSTLSRRQVFKMNPFKGLMTFKDGEWKRVIVDVEGKETITRDFGVALHHVIDLGGVFVITNAHTQAETLMELLSGTYSYFRDSFYSNNADDLPCQLVLLSHTVEVPPEIANETSIVQMGNLTPEEATYLMAYITGESTKENPLTEEDFDIEKAVRNVAGLSEGQLIEACVSSIREIGTLNEEYLKEFTKNKIRASGFLEVKEPKFNLDEVGGLDILKDTIEKTVWCWENEEEAARLNIKPVNKILTVGVQGTGKSMICEATAKTLGTDLLLGGVSKVMNKFIGQSEENARAMFAQVNAMSPVTLWIDELGRDFSSSTMVNDGGTTSRVHEEMLTGLQELDDKVFLMAAANNIDYIAPEMLRAGRFSKIFFVGFPTLEERKEIFKVHLGEAAENYDLDTLASRTGYFTGAEIEDLIIQTSFKFTVGTGNPTTTEDIISTIPDQKNRMWLRHRDMIKGMYMQAKTEWNWASSSQKASCDNVIAERPLDLEGTANTTARDSISIVPSAPASAGRSFK